ncbi:MAG: 1-deoxy-D-xylulose-5-phosphate synthase [Bacteroidales bacterium]|nr:1-deoxy-D-xylulose-5-phosphate synthase [Bacteroidales bacterium]MCI2145308.1 1-deoxy-D-xylulose-5-phosphate synthase [Bacteroidales bacterium]
MKKLSRKELLQLCDEIREYLIDCCSKNPGHLGASLGTVELCVALHYVFDTPKDKIIFDVGHQAYAHKIITGRREAFLRNRKFDGISGFPKRSESEYDAFGTGHASTSISAALGMAVAAKYEGSNEHVIAVIGDGAMTGGLAYEGLNNAGSLKTNLLIILNDNQISIDKNTTSMHNYLVKLTTDKYYNKFKENVWTKLGKTKFRKWLQTMVKNLKRTLIKPSETATLFDSLGIRYFGPIDGNNLNQLIFALDRLKDIKGPKLLHIITVKGKGFKPAELSQTVWHAPGYFDPITGELEPKNHGNIWRYQDVFGETLLELAMRNPKIIGVTPAMATGCGMNIMMKKMPERVFDVGIEELHAVTFSAGLAAEGLLPYCNIYSSFMQRGFDGVIHDTALQNLKVVFCLDRSGLVGEDGATHHGVFDMAFFRPIPDLVIASPYDERELRNMLFSASMPEWKTTIIRYPRGYGEGVSWKGEPFSSIEVGKARKMSDGKGVALLSIGPIGNKGAKAVSMAREAGFNVMHYDMRFLKPIDTMAIEDAAANAKTIVTLEDGTVLGGLHGAVAEYLADRNLDCKVIPLGVPDKFIGQGSQEELYTYCQYNTEDIFHTILSALK